jgi:hypothetical protein
VERDVFSSPVPPQNLETCADLSRFSEKYGGVSLRRRLCGGEGGIRTLDTGVSPYNGLANRRLQPLGHLSGVGGFSLPRRVRCSVHAAIAANHIEHRSLGV